MLIFGIVYGTIVILTIGSLIAILIDLSKRDKNS